MTKPSWCASLPLVDIPQGDTPKPVTLIYPYYRNPKFVREQVGRWQVYPEAIRRHLSAIIIDDGTQVDYPDEGVKQAFRGCYDGGEWRSDPLVEPFPIRLFQIKVDRPWNWLTARNIGAHESKDGWLVLTDMDHVLPADTAAALIFGKHDPACVYAFSRIEGCDNPRANTKAGDTINPHSASFFMTNTLFWRIGGYDERFSGHYGSDGQYRRRLQTTAPLQILRDRLIRHEYQGDSSTLAYPRKTKADNEAIQRIAASIPAGAKPKVLSFEYQEVPL